MKLIIETSVSTVLIQKNSALMFKVEKKGELLMRCGILFQILHKDLEP